eukprot:Skav229154  [mRNA]  locus=scaffold2275:254850:259671:+ [translate_table: standard]
MDSLSPFLLSRLGPGRPGDPTGMTSSQLGIEIQQASIMLIGDLETPESGCTCRVIQSLLQNKMHEGVAVVNCNK